MSIIISLDRALRERVTRPVLLSVAKWHDAAQRHDRDRRAEHQRMSRELRDLAAQLPVRYPPLANVPAQPEAQAQAA